MRKITYIFLVLFLVFLASPSLVCYGGEVELLINKLIEKKILSEKEAKELMDQISKESEKEAIKTRQYTKQVAQQEVKANVPEIPSWVKNIKLKGDIRLRYQSEERDNIVVANQTNRERYRFRWRLGMESKIADQWLGGFGLCSGSDDPRSTNQTFENTFQSPDARIDYVFVRYTPIEWLTLWGGKYPNPLWQTKDLLWDTDIMTDGVSLVLRPKVSKEVEPWISASWFLVDEINLTRDKADPSIVAVQVGSKFKFSEFIDFSIAPAYYFFNNQKDDLQFDHAASGNTTYTSPQGWRYLYSYDSFGLDAAINIYPPSPFIQKVTLFGQYINSDADKDNKGYLYGIAFGSKKIQKLGDWEFKYNYRKLEADAWPDSLPDSDIYGGSTNIKGHEFELTLGIAKNVTIGFDYYKSKPIEKRAARTNTVPGPRVAMDPYNEEELLQIDLVVKW